MQRKVFIEFDKKGPTVSLPHKGTAKCGMPVIDRLRGPVWSSVAHRKAHKRKKRKLTKANDFVLTHTEQTHVHNGEHTGKVHNTHNVTKHAKVKPNKQVYTKANSKLPTPYNGERHTPVQYKTNAHAEAHKGEILRAQVWPRVVNCGRPVMHTEARSNVVKCGIAPATQRRLLHPCMGAPRPAGTCNRHAPGIECIISSPKPKWSH